MQLRRLFRLVGLMLSLTAAVLVVRLADAQWSAYSRADRGLRAVGELRIALVAAEMLSRERGPANSVLGDATPPHPQRLADLATARGRTDAALDALQRQLAALAPGNRQREAAERFADARLALGRARMRLDRTAAQPRSQRSPDEIRLAIQQMVDVVPMLAPAVSALLGDALEAVPTLARSLNGARLVAELREYAGQLGSLFIPALAREAPFTADERDAIERVRGRIDQLRFLLDLQVAVPDQSFDVLTAYVAMNDRYFQSARALLARTIAIGRGDGRFGMDAADFTARYVPDMNSMIELRDALLDGASAAAAAARDEARLRLALVAAGSALFVLLLVTMLWLLRSRVLRPLAGATRALRALARGDLDAPVPTARAEDEIAQVLGAVNTLKQHMIERVSLERERAGLIARLRDQSSTDFLTGLPNRRAFLGAAERELVQAQRHGFGVVAIAIDIDHFKRVNDRFGHAAGDQVLIAVAATLQRRTRQGDLTARLGGEEFVMLLSHCGLDAGARFAEALRVAIASMEVSLVDAPDLRVTASLGVAASTGRADAHEARAGLEALLGAADRAMYRAKHNGRNGVVTQR